MNAAYLMLTTAWLAGQGQPPAAQPAPAGQPAPAAAPVMSSSLGACNGGCGGCATDCCDSGRKGLLSRLFSRNRNDCCAPAPTCCAPVVHKAPCCAPAPTCCAPVQTCNTCAPANTCCEEKHGLFSKLRGIFKRDKGCGCESSCGCGSTGGAWAAPATGAPAEAIPGQPRPGEAPRRMPGTTGGGGVAPMTINGVISDVTPVYAPRQPF